MQSHAILELPENVHGQDFVVGDLHGSWILLKTIVEGLNPADRLFLVGDLIDRGKDSFGVLNYIKTMSKKQKLSGKSPAIYAVQGNHEDMFLKYAKARRTPQKTNQHEMDIGNYIRNGGDWADKLPNTTLAEVAKFLSELPHVISVKGKNKFKVVHAGLELLSDEELANRIKENNVSLSDEDKNYIMWARKSGDVVYLTNSKRTSDSDPVYCGHTVMGGLRAETNHINLDVGTFENHTILIVNHSKGTSRVLQQTMTNSPDWQQQIMADAKNQIDLLSKQVSQHLQTTRAKKYISMFPLAKEPDNIDSSDKHQSKKTRLE